MSFLVVEKKGCTISAVSRPVSPRLWKNVTTAALEKVELQVICRHSKDNLICITSVHFFFLSIVAREIWKMPTSHYDLGYVGIIGFGSLGIF